MQLNIERQTAQGGKKVEEEGGLPPIVQVIRSRLSINVFFIRRKSGHDLFTEASVTEADAGEKRIELGVAERARPPQLAPSADAVQAVGVQAIRDHRRAVVFLKVLKAYRTGPSSNRR